MEFDNSEKWVKEADAIINDLKHHVQIIAISNSLPNSSIHIYLNVETLEGNKYCIELSGNGFSIVSNSFDNIDKKYTSIIYETPQALLSSISKQYRESFSGELTARLTALSKQS